MGRSGGGIVVGSAICAAEDPRAAARTLRSAVDSALKSRSVCHP